MPAKETPVDSNLNGNRTVGEFHAGDKKEIYFTKSLHVKKLIV
jgi:hypothetical protein